MTVYQEDKVSSDKLRRSEIFLLVLALVVLLLQLQVGAFWGSESRWGEVVREMFETGNFSRAAINDKIYLHKPLFSYWIILPFARLFGLTEFACRLPGAIAGWLLLAAQLFLGRHFFDRRTALFSAWLLFCSYGFIFWSRRVSEVMPEAALAAWAAVAFLSQEERRSLWKSGLFYFLTGCLLFNNRLYGVLILAAILIPYTIYSGCWRHILDSTGKKVLLAVNVIFFFALYVFTSYFDGTVDFSAGAELLWRLPWGFVKEFGKLELCSFPHGEFFVHNWIDFFRVILPWGLWFVAAVAGMIANYRNLNWKSKSLLWSCAAVALLAFFVRAESWGNPMIFAGFSCIVSAGALNTDSGNGRLNFIAGKIMYVAMLLFGALALAFGVLIPVWNVFFSINMPLGILISVPLAGLAAQAIMLYDDKAAEKFSLPTGFGATVLAGTVLLTVIFSFIYPALDNFRKSKDFLLQAKALMQQENITKLICVGQSIDAEELFYIAPALPVKDSGYDLNGVALIWEDTPENADLQTRISENQSGFVLTAVLEEEFSELRNSKDDEPRRMFGILKFRPNKE